MCSELLKNCLEKLAPFSPVGSVCKRGGADNQLLLCSWVDKMWHLLQRREGGLKERTFWVWGRRLGMKSKIINSKAKAKGLFSLIFFNVMQAGKIS